MKNLCRIPGTALRTLLLAVLACLGPVTEAAAGEPPKEETRSLLRHADTYYWFGMAEKGNMSAFLRGQDFLDRAGENLKQASLPPGERDALLREIEALRTDLENQADIAHDTFYGVFPLVRLLAPTLFVDAGATGTFELVDDPDIIAATSAGEALANQIVTDWKSLPQLDVVFTSVPRNAALENELLYIFNVSPKYFVHSLREVSSALPPERAESFLRGELASDDASAIRRAFDVPRILVVTVSEIDIVEPDYFFLVEARLFEADRPAPSQTLSVMGFCRDRRSCLGPILAANLIAAVLAVASFVLLTLLRRSEIASTGAIILVPLSGFLLGRVLPWILSPLVASVAPAPETLAKLAFWWPGLAGAALFLGPPVLYRIASKRLQSFLPILGMDGKGGAVFVPIALGMCAYLAGPLFLLMGGGALAVLLPLSGALVLSAYLLGRTLDQADSYPLAAAVLPVLAAPVLGIGTAMTSTAVPGIALLLLAAFGTGVAWVHRRRRTVLDPEPPAPDPPPEGEGPRTAAELARMAERPPYRRFETFRRAFERLEPALSSRASWLALVGPSGVGKTATVQALTAQLKSELLARKGALAVMAGECPEATGGGDSYAPFRKALAAYFEVNLLAPPGPQLEQIDGALEELFDSVVPFSGLLFPSASGAENAPGSKREVFLSIARTIRKVAAKKTVLLFVDDAQWIDPDSRELLAFLGETFPAGSPVSLAVLITGRKDTDLSALGMEGCGIEVAAPTEAERAEILTAGLSIAPDLAGELVLHLAGAGSGQGELFWLLQVISHFAREGVFRREGNRFVLSKDASLDSLPYPEDFQAALAEEFEKIPQHRSLLECAACLGLEFPAEILAKSMGRPRLEVLRALAEIEAVTGLLRDMEEQDDVFAFRSSFVLESLRKFLRISGRGPRAKDVPQVIREYHARLADALEGTLEGSPGAVFETARHAYAAGASRAELGFSACLRAAHAASETFSHDRAREFLDMARECARSRGRDEPLVEERLRVDAHEAHVSGLHRPEVAERFLSHLAAHPDVGAGLRILGARSCYDAGIATGDQRFFREAVRLGRGLIDDGGSALERAEGHHFVGIALPPGEADDREKQLRAALSLVSDAAPDDLPAQALRGRVANSLAEQLGGRRNDRRAEAPALFDLSIQIKERPELRDLPGLARSNGGLGRYHLFSDPPDLVRAREYFKKDLELSERIGDRTGECKMHSFLAQCDLREDRFEAADRLYAASFELAQDDVDRFFAAIGRLQCLSSLGTAASIEEVGRDLLERARSAGVPPFCIRPLQGALKRCRGLEPFGWMDELETLCAVKGP